MAAEAILDVFSSQAHPEDSVVVRLGSTIGRSAVRYEAAEGQPSVGKLASTNRF